MPEYIFSVLQSCCKALFLCMKGGEKMADYVPEEIEKWISDRVVKQTRADVEKKTSKAIRHTQDDMLSRIIAASPVRHYSTHTQVVSHITVHRSRNAARAVHVAAPEKEQPGYFKAGWVRGTLKTKSGKIYGVRNKNMHTVPHLLNFDRRYFSHRHYIEILEGSGFMDRISEDAQRELDAELEQFLETFTIRD